MRVIVSHDVDHLSVREHKKDLIIQKFIVRSMIETVYGTVSLKTFKQRISDLAADKWNSIEEILEFDSKHSVKSTFFFAMASDKKTLNYTNEKVQIYIKKVREAGFDVGVHGINHLDKELMQSEFNKFKQIVNNKQFGIRMHYLRNNKETFEIMDELGYLFDTTEYCPDLKQPYMRGNILEIPFHLMDTYIFSPGRFQKNNFDYAVNLTKEKIDQVSKIDGILNINFHPNYFCGSWPDWKEWYMWFIEYCNHNNIPFVNYGGIVNEFKNSTVR